MIDNLHLFDPTTPCRQWAEFCSDGFSDPVSGIVFRGGQIMPGMPLGGLGTGFISLGTDGTLDYYSTIFNAFMEREIVTMANCDPPVGENADLSIRRSHVPTKRRPFLGLSVDGHTWVLTTHNLAWTLPGLHCAQDIRYWGHYPVADLQYETDAPIDTALRAWSPFLPGDAEASNTPGAVFEVRLRNATDDIKKVTLAFSFHGPRDFETGGPVNFLREAVDDSFTGTIVKTRYAPEELSYAIGVMGSRSVRCGGEVAGGAWKTIDRTLPTTPLQHAGTTVAVDFELAPSAHETIRFILTWYGPRWQAEERVPFPGVKGVNSETGLAWYQSVESDDDLNLPEGAEADTNRRYWSHSRLVHMYASRFSSARDVASHLATNHQTLLRRILAWQEVIYAEPKLPTWLRDSLVNVLGVLSQQSFWMRNADPEHWWGEEGFFGVNESLLACPQLACIANDEFGDWPVNLFFPQLTRTKLRVFKHHQKANGQTPATLGSGTEPDGHWYDQQLPVDGQVYVHLVYRIWQATGDPSILEQFYESVRDGIHFLQTVDADGDGLLEVKGNNQYYDNWPAMAGAAIHISGYWIATLRIAEDMAKTMNDNAFADECRGWIERGTASIESKLWNEKQASYLLYHQPETGARSDSILSDQLIGQWFTHLHGLPAVFPESRVDIVLETIWKHNVQAAEFGVRTAIKPDLSTDIEGFYSSKQNPSYSSLVPSMLMIFRGDPDRGLDLMHSIWHKLVLEKQNMWDMPCQITAEGDVAFGLEYFHNTMLWSLPMAVLGQEVEVFCGCSGLAGRIVAAATADS